MHRLEIVFPLFEAASVMRRCLWFNSLPHPRFTQDKPFTDAMTIQENQLEGALSVRVSQGNSS